jgi:hypothetical protein
MMFLQHHLKDDGAVPKVNFQQMVSAESFTRQLVPSNCQLTTAA